MIIGKRVAERMEAVGLTQAALARRVGVSQPSIFKLIHENKTGSTRIHKIARELGTTPAYLMGETTDPKGDIELDAYSSEERDFVDLIRHLTPGDRKTVMALMKSLAQTGTGSLNSPKLTYRAGD